MEKRYIVPLPGLVTTDGQQQYLTNRGGRWFACRRRSDLRQTWKEEHLGYVPEIYRQFAVEIENSEDEKMEERNRLFRFMFGPHNVVDGSVVSRFGPVNNLDEIKKDLCEDFIKIENADGELLLSTKHIVAVEEI